jgi:hypothetical protein
MIFSRFLAFIPAILLTAVTADSIAATVVQGTAFTYQGQLNAGGILPAGQTYQFTFTLYDAASGGNVVGAAIPKAILVGNGGLFTTDLDFGQIFNGTQYWLDIQVGTTNLNEQELAARQPINAVPVAQYALNTPPGSFAQFYWASTGTTPPLVASLADFPFPNSGPTLGVLANLGGTSFTPSVSGIYEVSFEINLTPISSNSAVGLTVNSVLVPQCQFAPTTNLLAGKCLVPMQAGDVISVVNTKPSAVALLAGDLNTITANLVIKLMH